MSGIDQRTSGVILVVVLLSMIGAKAVLTGFGRNNVKKSVGPVFAHVMNNFMLVFCGLYVACVQILRLPAAIFLGSVELPFTAVLFGVTLCFIAVLLFFVSLAAMGNNFQFAGTTPREGDALVTGGPYRFMRHPLYVAGFLFTGGLALAFQSGYLLVLLAPYLLTLAWLVSFEESQLERSYGSAFIEYRNKTGLLVPRLNPARTYATETLAGVFLRSMKDDPLYRFLFPTDAGQEKYLRRFWKALVGYTFANGSVRHDPELKGAACWLPPGKNSFTFRRLAKAGFAFPLSVFLFPRQAGSRAMKIFAYLENIQNATLREPHWYLMAIGVDPGSQKRGIGRFLIASVLRQADADGVTCYLETETERNVHFYRSLGFEVRGEFTVPGTDLLFYAMTRAPEMRDL